MDPRLWAYQRTNVDAICSDSVSASACPAARMSAGFDPRLQISTHTSIYAPARAALSFPGVMHACGGGGGWLHIEQVMAPHSLAKALLDGFRFLRRNQSGNGGAKAVGKLDQRIRVRQSFYCKRIRISKMALLV
jgi:hypothetical protein